MHTVERVFGIGTLSKQAGVEKSLSPQLAKTDQMEASRASGEQAQGLVKGISLEEKRRQAIENWRRDYYDKRSKGIDPDGGKDEPGVAEKTRDERDAGLDFDPKR